MRRFIAAIAVAMLATVLTAPAGAGAVTGCEPAVPTFGLCGLDVTFAGSKGSPAMQAGSHPFSITNTLAVNTTIDPKLGKVPVDAIKDLRIDFPPGLVANPGATPQCTNADFVTLVNDQPTCPTAAAIGVATVEANSPETFFKQPVYNLVPAPGVVARIGFVVAHVAVSLDLSVNPNPPYNPIASVSNVPQAAAFYSSRVTVWGNPADPVHDAERGSCVSPAPDTCPVSIANRPFLPMPRSCAGPLRTSFKVVSWQNPTAPLPPYTVLSHDDAEPPNPSPTGCSILAFAPQVDSQPTTDQAESPSGFDFNIDVNNEGLDNPDGIAQSDIKKTVVTLPEGVTVNPSVAEGLATCTKADFESESVDSEVGEGCPEASKVGTVEVETPLLEGKILKGQVFVAAQDDPATAEPGAENPFDSLIALYMVIKDPGLGVLVKLPGKVEPDAETGQLVTTFGEAPYEVPQFPFSHFRFHFREGGRSPLITPPACGNYTTKVEFTPWANPSQPLTTTASFGISRGVGGGPCPTGGPAPFAPGFEAGSINNSAGAYTPFYLRLIRHDGEQDLTRFSFALPPGLVGKIAGVAKCPDAAIQTAKAKTGRQELASPSCPAASQIGRTLAGAGVGSQLTYVPGRLYLAGPFGGDPLSVIAITPAVAGPFDAGTVVVHVALTLDPRTAQVQVDSARSDPIPHILKGIPLRLRDLRAYADRPQFTLNPTDCDPAQVRATLFGSYLDFFNPADDVPVSVSTRFQAVNCASLGFKPALSLKLKVGTKRGAHPALEAVLRPRSGDANLAGTVVRLPHSAFLDQAHIRTVCTRVQYAAKQCPAGSIYGHVRAFSPLLDEPLEGPIYLRSSDHDLPDLVFALHGVVDIETSARIDSIKGGIRATFENVPDAPLSKAVVQMQGAKKGVIVNSTDLCHATHRARVDFSAHNGKLESIRPVLKPSCKKRHGAHRRKR